MQSFLSEGYEGKIDLIYTDPPFNTDSVVNATWRKLSVMKYWRMKKELSVDVRKSIYEKMPFGHGAGLEKSFVIGVLEKSPEVRSWSKLNDKRGSFHLHIKYLANDGNFKSYFPDFLVKTDKKIYLVETKSDRDFEKDPDVQTKAVNARKMASLFSKVKCTFTDLNQPQDWEYILIPESRFNENINLSFEALASVCKDATDRLTFR
jgi:type III restriction enzyme